MPVVRIDSLGGAVHIQDPSPSAQGLSVSVAAGSHRIFACTWEVLQRITSQIASLEALGAITYDIQASATNLWAQEGDLPGMPRIDRVAKHDLTLAGETGLELEGIYFLGGQSFASTLLAYVAANTSLTVAARTPGFWGNELSVEIEDTAGGGLTVAVTGGDHLVIDLGGATPDATTIAAAVNADATASLLFNVTVVGTGAGLPTIKDSQDLSGGIGPGLAVTCAGVACDVKTITGTAPNHAMTIDIPNLAASCAAGEAVNLELRTGGKLATVSLQIVP